MLRKSSIMKKTVLLLLAFVSIIRITGQEPQKPGYLSGSFETLTQVYLSDTTINALLPQDRVGSNNYLKLDYYYKSFSGGIQIESYLPSVAGYPVVLNETSVINRYFKYTGEKLSVQVGDFYEQFGSGLVFRSWENRQIGINNAVEGVNIQVNPTDFFRLKAIYGRQRKGFEHSASNVRGIDATLDLMQSGENDMKEKLSAQLGFSYVSRYQEYTGPELSFPSTVNAYSARMDLFRGAFSLSGEYLFKSKDPQIDNSYSMATGTGILINGSMAMNRVGMTLTFRSLRNMSYRGERDATGVLVPVNYIPALTKHHEYLVTNIYVYNPQPSGETGIQADIFLKLGKVSVREGKFGSDLDINLAWYGGQGKTSNLFSYGNNYFRDASIEWKKKWTKKLRTTMQLQYLFYNKSVIEGGIHENVSANTVVISTIYNFRETTSFHIELQHLCTKNDQKNWAAFLAEISFAPEWSFFLTDLYNYGQTDTHYPTIGGNYSFGGNRFSLSYGRQRAGLFCVGGICRYVPAATGFSVSFISTFN